MTRRKSNLTNDNKCSHCQFYLGNNPPDICPNCNAQIVLSIADFDPYDHIPGDLQPEHARKTPKKTYEIWNGCRCGRCGGYVDEGMICGQCALIYDDDGHACE